MSELFLADEHRETEELLAKSGIEHAVLSNGWHRKNYASSLQSGQATSKLFEWAGAARVSGAAASTMPKRLPSY